MSFTEKNEKEEILLQLWSKANEVQHKIATEDDTGKQWLINNSPTEEIAAIVKEMTVLMLHILAAIGKKEPVNGISISKEFNIPRGSVSKITKKLVERELIVIETLPQNKKELLFRTTTVGMDICNLHEKLHQQMDRGIHQFLNNYSKKELATVLKVLIDLEKTSLLK